MENRVKELRIKHKLSQVELAISLGISRQSVISIEKGQYKPSLLLSFKFAKIFSLSIEDIFIPNEKELEL